MQKLGALHGYVTRNEMIKPIRSRLIVPCLTGLDKSKEMTRRKLNKQENFNQFSQSAYLMEGLELGIIDSNTVLDDIKKAMRRKQILEKHKYAISTIQENGKTIYQTYLPTLEGGRMRRQRNTLEELQDVIVEHYKSKTTTIRINEVFREWADEKLEIGDIKGESFDRYENDYKRFIENASVADFLKEKPFCQITEGDLERFIKITIREKNLSVKTYGGLKTVIISIFKYAKKKKYTTLGIADFFEDLVIPRNMFKRKVIDPHKEVFSQEEIPLVINYLHENEDIKNLGILLLFETGMRVGELSALKADDIETDFLKVQRSEEKYRDRDTKKWVITVSDYTKSAAGDRIIYLTEKARETVRKILTLNPNGKFLFEINRKRIKGTAFTHRLYRICDKLSIPRRSAHKIRKTYGTALIDGAVDESIIASQMGHSDTRVTRQYYYFSNQSKDNLANQIGRAIKY